MALLVVLSALGGCAGLAPPLAPIPLESTCPSAYLDLDEATCEQIRPAGYGLSPTRPLAWGSGGLGPLWYGRIKCDDGREPRVLQLPQGEAAPPTSAPLSALGLTRGEGGILDIWSVQCGETLQTWYVDMYHCGNPCPPEGATVLGSSAFSLYQSSFSLARQGQPAGAIGAMSRAVVLEPESEGLWTWLGTLQLAEGRFDDALKSLKTAATFDPQDVDLQLQMGIALFELERFPEYLEQLDGVMSTLPPTDHRLPELLCRRSLTLMALDRMDEGQLWATRSCAMGFWPCCGVAPPQQ